MDFIKNIIQYFKKIFSKQETLQLLEAPPKQEYIKIDQKQEFLKSLKVKIPKKKIKSKVETLICEGDGMGIQNKMSY